MVLAPAAMVTVAVVMAAVLVVGAMVVLEAAGQEEDVEVEAAFCGCYYF